MWRHTAILLRHAASSFERESVRSNVWSRIGTTSLNDFQSIQHFSHSEAFSTLFGVHARTFSSDQDNSSESKGTESAVVAEENSAEAEEALTAAKTTAPAGRRKRFRRKDFPKHEDVLEVEADEWPEAEEIIGPIPHIYDVRSLILNAELEKGTAQEMVEGKDFPHPYEQMLKEEAMKEEEEGPYPGATKFLNWEVSMMIQCGDDMYHPMNNKVKMWYDVCEMKGNLHLTEEAVERMVLLVGDRFRPARKYRAGPRSGPPKGTIMITSEKYFDREDNRRHIMEMFNNLLDESRKAGTPEDPLLECDDYQELLAQKEALKERQDLKPFC